MDALEISAMYYRMAGESRDKRWKEYFLGLAREFGERWFK
jgi:hypothetical protein